METQRSLAANAVIAFLIFFILIWFSLFSFRPQVVVTKTDEFNGGKAIGMAFFVSLGLTAVTMSIVALTALPIG